MNQTKFYLPIFVAKSKIQQSDQNFPNFYVGQKVSYLHTNYIVQKVKNENYTRQHFYDTWTPTKILNILYLTITYKDLMPS